MARVDVRVGLQVVERAAGAPGPGAQDAPVFRLAVLAGVGDADYALGQAGAPIGLDGVGLDHRHRPAVGDELVQGRRIALDVQRRCGEPGRRERLPGRVGLEHGLQRRITGGQRGFPRGVDAGQFVGRGRGGRGEGQFAQVEHHQGGHRTFVLRRLDQHHRDVFDDRRIVGIVDMADQPGGDDRGEAEALVIDGLDPPGDLGRGRGDAAINLPLEDLRQLRPALGSPLVGGLHLRPVGIGERIGIVRPGVGLGLVVVDREVLGLGVVVHPVPEHADAQLLHHLLMVLRRRDVRRRGFGAG